MSNNRPCPYCGSASCSIKFVEPPFRVLKCSHCSLVYLGNPPDDGLIYERYYESPEADAGEYRSESGNMSLTELFAINKQRISFIKTIQSPGMLLDVGCGRGYFLKTARDHGFTVHGIDVSDRAIEYAQREFTLSADVQKLDDLASSGRHFDVITLWHVLEHFTDPIASLRQVRSLLTDGGICVLEVPNLHSLKFMAARNKWQGGNHPLYHRTFFTTRTLRNVLLKAGFSRPHRAKLSYHVPGRSYPYEALKEGLNLVAMDAFLDFVARK